MVQCSTGPCPTRAQWCRPLQTGSTVALSVVVVGHE